jgi:hypothetical protein
VSRYSLWKIHRISEDLNADLLTAPSESWSASRTFWKFLFWQHSTPVTK